MDSKYAHLTLTKTDRINGGLGLLKYPLIADVRRKGSHSYGMLINSGVALRGLFSIDKEGIIQHSTINNLSVGRSLNETLRILQALQYGNNNPDETCPVDWALGDATIIPDI